MYEPRHYRQLVAHEDLVSFRVCLAETDLQVAAATDLSAKALAAVRAARADIEAEIAQERRFLTSLEPLPLRPEAPALARAMYRAALTAGVGPMAAVAGAVAEAVGRALLPHSAQVIVENGGDIFLQTDRPRVIGIYAGPSPLSGRFGLQIPAGSRLGICTSSATVGPSLSLGKTDAALVICRQAALADAFASTLGNMVQTPADVPAAIEWARRQAEIRQALVIIGETLGVCGQYELVPV